MKWNLSRGLDIHSALRALLMLCTGLLVTIVSFEQPAAAFTTIPQSHISSTTIWSSAASPYIITGDVTIDNGATLTIQPDVVVKFQSGAGIIVNGGLSVPGITDHPVYFTTIHDTTTPDGDAGGFGNVPAPAAGSWKGIWAYGSGIITIDHGIIRYAGGSGDDAIYKTGSAGNLTVTNCIISTTTGAGVHTRNTGSITTSVAGTQVSDSSSFGIWIESATGTATIDTNSIQSSGRHGIYVSSPSTAAAVAITANSVSGTGSGSHGISLMNTGTTTILTNNFMTNAGGYGLYLDGNSNPTLNDAQNYGSNGYGYMGFSPDAARFASDYDQWFDPVKISHPVYVESGAVSTSGVWKSSRVHHIRHGDISVGSLAILTLTPGTIIKFESGGFGLHVGGSLIADATAGNEIIFTDYRDDSAGGDTNQDGAPGSGGASPVAGSWKEVEFVNGGIGVLNHCIIRYTGSSGYGAVLKSGPGRLIVTNSEITDSAMHGVEISSSSGVNHDISNNLITRHARNGITLDGADGALTIAGNTITAIGQHGIFMKNCGISPTLTGNTIQQNGASSYALYLMGFSVPALADAQQFGNNGMGIMGFDILASKFASTYDSLLPAIPIYVDGGTIPASSVITWSSSRKYLVRSDSITVNNGGTFVVNPGVTVRFGLHLGVYVYGLMTANGTPASRIIFTSYQDSSNGDTGSTAPPAPADWKGLWAYTGGSMDIRYCTITYAGFSNDAVYKTGAGGSLTVRNCTIGNTYGPGVDLLNTTASYTIADTSIIGAVSSSNIPFGIQISSATGVGTISNNTLSNNKYGIYVQGTNASTPTAPVIQGNTITLNGDSGVYLDGAGVRPAITRNNLIANGKYGIYATNGANPLVGGSKGFGNNLYDNSIYSLFNTTSSTVINAQNNYWGDPNGPYNAPENLGGNPNSKVSAYVDYGSWSTPPSGGISINGGDIVTNTTLVSLTISCNETSSCVQMQFSNDNITYSELQPFAVTTTPDTWQLAGTIGTNYVYVRFLYGDNLWSPVYQSSINFETLHLNAPNVSGPASTINPNPTWTWSSVGAGGTGLYRFQMNSEAGLWSTLSATSYTPRNGLPPGSYTLYVQEQDATGNWSPSGSWKIDVVDSRILSTLINGKGTLQGTSTQQQEFHCTSGVFCVVPFQINDQIQLTAVPATGFTFSAWSGDCAGTLSTCTLSLSANRSTTAIFVTAKPAMLQDGGQSTLYSTLADAYNFPVDYSTIIIKGQAVTFTGGLILNRPIAVTLDGGYDPSFNTNSGYSTIKGKLVIVKGSLVAGKLVVK